MPGTRLPGCWLRQIQQWNSLVDNTISKQVHESTRGGPECFNNLTGRGDQFNMLGMDIVS